MVSVNQRAKSEIVADSRISETSSLLAATNAVFQRHWYTSLAALLDEFPSLSESLAIQVEMPCAISDWISITGEWYLGAATCSRNREAALSIMKNFISSESETTMILSSAALPVLESTYISAEQSNVTALNSSLLLSDIIRFYKLPHAYSRRDIYCYSKIVPLLSKCFERIIGLNPDPDFPRLELRSKIQNILSHYAEQIKLLLRLHFQ
jgi:hypothetical protein